MRDLLKSESSFSSSHYGAIAFGPGIIGFVTYKYFFGGKQSELQKVHVDRQTPEKKKHEAQHKVRGKPISLFD